jgi:rhamnulokinase
MLHPHRYLAFDLGAESGRAILGELDDHRLVLKDVHRFANGPVLLPRADPARSTSVGQFSLQWDILRLLSEIKKAISLAASQFTQLDSMGIDTWGVDFGLLDRHGVLLENPYHYRDGRTDGMVEAAFQRAPRDLPANWHPVPGVEQPVSASLDGSEQLNRTDTGADFPHHTKLAQLLADR